MAIVSVRKLFEERGGHHSWENHRDSPRIFEVVTDSDSDAENEVVNAVDPNDGTLKIPEFGDLHPNIGGCIAVDFQVDQSAESPRIWYVRVEYSSHPNIKTAQGMDPNGNSSEAAGERPGNVADNPLLRPPQWRITTIDRHVPVKEWLRIKPDGDYDFKDPPAWVAATAYKVGTYVKNGGNVYYCVVAGTSAGAGGPAGVGQEILDNTAIWDFFATVLQVTNDPRFAILTACLNSGSTPFDPPAMTDDAIPVITFTKFIASVSIAYAMRIKNAVNLTTWRGVPPRCARCLRFEAGNKPEGGQNLIEATWEIGLDPDTWDLRILDAGFGTLAIRDVPNPAPPPATLVTKRFYAFKDDDGAAFTNPVPMDGQGRMLPPDSDPVFLRGVPRQVKFIDFNQEVPF